MANDESRRLIDQICGGDSAAATEVFNRYVVRLLSLVRTRLSSKLAKRVDPEDVVQSAYRSFFRRVASDEIVLRRAGDLWRVLAAFAINKVRGQIEFHSAARRGIDGEADLPDVGQYLVTDSEPSVEQAAMIADELEAIVVALRPRERAVLEGRLQGQTIEQIAADMSCSQRTVRRLLAHCQSVVEHRFLESSDAEE